MIYNTKQRIYTKWNISLSEDRCLYVGMQCAKSCERMFDTNWLGYNFQFFFNLIENGFLDCVIYFVIEKGRRSITSEHFTMTIHQKPKILLCMKTIYFIPPKKNMRCVTIIQFLNVTWLDYWWHHHGIIHEFGTKIKSSIIIYFSKLKTRMLFFTKIPFKTICGKNTLMISYNAYVHTTMLTN